MAVQEQMTGGGRGISVGSIMRDQAGDGRSSSQQLQERPGHSEMMYMQHKYTPLDLRIIISTAAILVLLLSVLFLNFCIRWTVRRFALMRAQKLLNPNKGLSKRQVQALPTFIYSSSNATMAPSPLHTFPPHLKPTVSHHLLKLTLTPHDPHTTKIGPPHSSYLTLSGHNANKLDHTIPFTHGDHDPTFDQSSTLATVDELLPKNCLNKFDSLDPPIKSLPKSEGEPLSDANPLTSFIKNNIPNADKEAIKANQPIPKDSHCMRGFDKVDHVSTYDNDAANSTTLCPICLIEYTDGDALRVLPPCRHYFHITCIGTWLAKNSSCPVCRVNVLETTQTQAKRPNLHVQVIITTTN